MVIFHSYVSLPEGISHYGKYNIHIPTFCPIMSHPPLGRSHGGVIEGCRLAADVVRAAVLRWNDGGTTDAERRGHGERRFQTMKRAAETIISP